MTALEAQSRQNVASFVIAAYAHNAQHMLADGSQGALLAHEMGWRPFESALVALGFPQNQARFVTSGSDSLDKVWKVGPRARAPKVNGD